MLSYAKSATDRPGDRLNGFENGKTQLFNSWGDGKWAYFQKKWSVPLKAEMWFTILWNLFKVHLNMSCMLLDKLLSVMLSFKIWTSCYCFSVYANKKSFYLLFVDLHTVRELKIGFISILRRHIYVAKCKWNHFNKLDRYSITKNTLSDQM